jgi:hypothetical protein
MVDFVNKSVYNEIRRKSNAQLDKDPKMKLKEFEYMIRQTRNNSKVNKSTKEI